MRTSRVSHSLHTPALLRARAQGARARLSAHAARCARASGHGCSPHKPPSIYNKAFLNPPIQRLTSKKRAAVRRIKQGSAARLRAAPAPAARLSCGFDTAVTWLARVAWRGPWRAAAPCRPPAEGGGRRTSREGRRRLSRPLSPGGGQDPAPPWLAAAPALRTMAARAHAAGYVAPFSLLRRAHRSRSAVPRRAWGACALQAGRKGHERDNESSSESDNARDGNARAKAGAARKAGVALTARAPAPSRSPAPARTPLRPPPRRRSTCVPRRRALSQPPLPPLCAARQPLPAPVGPKRVSCAPPTTAAGGSKRLDAPFPPRKLRKKVCPVCSGQTV